MMSTVIAYLPQLLHGLGITLLVALGSFICGLMAAIVLAPLAIYAPAPVRKAISVYVGLIRGLPELLVIFLIFYGGTVLLTNIAGQYVEVNAINAGIAALSFVSAAYLTEILRGALLSVSSGQWEAALALGLRRSRAFRLIALPQMMARALPGLGNQWLVILKESALVSIIGLEELMRMSVVAAGATRQPLAFYLTAAALYIVITGVSTLIIRAYAAHLTPQTR